MSSVFSDFSVGVGSLGDQVAGIPPFIDMFYFEIEFVVLERYIIIIFNKCLLSVQSIPMIGIESTKKYKVTSYACNELLIFGKAGNI